MRGFQPNGPESLRFEPTQVDHHEEGVYGQIHA